MDELIAKLERATGPDRELGNAVLLACGWELKEHGDGPDRKLYWRGPKFDDIEWDGDQPDPTASIEAALTLVPEKWDWLVSKGDDEPASVSLAPSRAIATVNVTHEIPAIALCIAALRARAHTPRERQEDR